MQVDRVQVQTWVGAPPDRVEAAEAATAEAVVKDGAVEPPPKLVAQGRGNQGVGHLAAQDIEDAERHEPGGREREGNPGRGVEGRA